MTQQNSLVLLLENKKETEQQSKVMQKGKESRGQIIKLASKEVGEKKAF